MSDGERSCGAKHTLVSTQSRSRRVGERINSTDGEDLKSLFIMGEDRVTFGERKNGDVMSSRQRHSSVISSCSEESETTSTGYTPTPDEDKEEELEYGPGIVNKLRTKFLSISLKQNRGTIRRSCSMENLLDQDRPSRSNIFSQNGFTASNKETEENSRTIWGNLKRAKSMDTLLMDLKQESSPIPMETVSEVNGDFKIEPKIVRRRDGGLNRTGQTICDEELPKPDTVKTYKRMFEPAESRRGSCSRKPPVLRASAKSGSLSVSKFNGVCSSAKVNGIVSKNKLSAKPSSPVKAQPDTEKVSNNIINQPLVNGDESKPQCNGNYVKASPVKIADNSLCNGKVEKSPEKEINGLNMNKKNIQNNQKNSVVVSNGNVSLKELIKTETSENYIKPDVKKLVNQTYAAVNGSDKPVVKPVLNGLNQKPKVPPNRPTFVKHAKFGLKVAELNGIDKKSPLIPKLKPIPTAIQKNVQDVIKPEIVSKIEENLISESKLSEDAVKEAKETEAKSPKISDENKTVEEGKTKISEKIETKVFEETAVEKKDLIPKIEVKKEVVNHINGDIVDGEKLTNSPKVDLAEIRPESKLTKKQQSSEPITTSMVFDFRGKDVVPHVAVLPVPFGCKALHPKKKTLLIDGKEVVNGLASEDDDEYHVDYSVPAPCGVVFEGENVKIGKGSILSVRNKDLKIKFDVNVNDNTFIYPSETSLLDESDASSSSPSPPPNEGIHNGQSSSHKLKNNPAMGSSGAGGLSTYTPSVLRTMDNFEPGMFRPPPPAVPEKEEEKNVLSGEEENTEVREDCQEKQEMLKPADPGIISSWSLSAGTSDLLF